MEPGERRRLVLRAVVRTVGTVTVLVSIYFVVPMDRAMDPTTVAELVLATVALLAIIGVQVWQITRSVHPGLRAVEAVAFTLPLLVLSFATTYYLTDRAAPGSFGEQLTRLDALYFSSTVFTTVGFGDIAAESETARTMVTIQMWLDLVVVGLVVRLGVNAVKFIQQHRAATPPDRTPG